MRNSSVFKPGDFVTPREGGSLGVVTSARPSSSPDIFWTVWVHDPDWCHPETHDALRPADIPPSARFLGQMLSDYRVIAQNPNIFPKSQLLITALRHGIQWHERGPILHLDSNGGTHGR